MITSSISGTWGATSAPHAEVRSVMRRAPADPRKARNAGVVISTSPRLSSRTARMFLASFQSAMLMIHAALERIGCRDHARRLGEIGHHPIGPAAGRVDPLGLVAVVEEHGLAAGAVARFDVVQDIADEPRLSKVEIMLARSLQDKPRCRLAAIASPGVLRDPAFGMVRAVIEAGERHVHAREQFADTVLHPAERTLIIVAMSHA